jgi:hypothetical protein
LSRLASPGLQCCSPWTVTFLVRKIYRKSIYKRVIGKECEVMVKNRKRRRVWEGIKQRQLGTWQDQDRQVDVRKDLLSNQRRASIFFFHFVSGGNDR